jgi:type II secretory pathway component PulJ
MIKIQSDNQGFTLVELLLYVFVASGILLSIVALVALLIQSRVKNQTISLVEQQGAQIALLISQEINNAKIITAPAVGNSGEALQFQDINNQTEQLSLVSSTLFLNKNNQNFALNPATILISNWQVKNLGVALHDSIKIKFDLNYNNLSGLNQYNYSQTFYVTANIR